MPRASLLACVGLVALGATEARAQTGFSWHVDAGGVVPLSAFVNTGIRVDEAVISAAGEPALEARLVDAYADPGFEISTTFLLNQFELRYAFHRLPWDREETICLGTGPGAELPNGAIDDALVDYSCTSGGPLAVDTVARDPIFLHVLSLGYRLYFLEPEDDLNVYAVGAPGLAIASYNEDRASSGVDLGFNLSLGLGAQLALSELFAVAVEARYSLLLNGPPSPVQAGANRARALDQTAWQATLNAFHYTSFTLGFHLSFR